MESNLVTIDIIQNVLQSPVAVGRYRGEEVCKIIDDKANNISSLSILLIDIRKANPLQYNFCQYAFGPLINKLQHNKNVPTIFRMHEHHKACFFRGVLKHIDKNLSRNDSEKVFIESGMFTMLVIDSQTEVKFISSLSHIEEEILYLINHSKVISERDIIETKKEMQPAHIIDALRSLDKKGFILHLKNDTDQYHSIYQYLNIK